MKVIEAVRQLHGEAYPKIHVPTQRWPRPKALAACSAAPRQRHGSATAAPP